MNNREYFQYLKALFDDTSKKDWDEDSVFGIFQRYRPDGHGVEEVFKPIEDGGIYISRILPIYKATAHDGHLNDMYFIVRNPKTSSKDQLRTIGYEFIARTKEFSKLVDDNELTTYIKNVSEVEFGEIETKEYESDEHLTVYEIIVDWLGTQENNDDLIPSISEAFYSIACDYWISYYIQWPYFKFSSSIDLFEPYLEIWKHGMSCVFKQDSLKIGKDV